MTEAELRALLPQHKSDCERARAIVALGYPAVAPVLRDLLEWLRDCNWPVSQSIAPFLVSVGEPMVPLIRDVLRGHDDIWKYWCIGCLILDFPLEVAEEFREELERLSRYPTNQESSEELDKQARAALMKLDSEKRSLGDSL